MPAGDHVGAGQDDRPATLTFTPPPAERIDARAGDRDAAAARRDALEFHRAQSPVPDGQPVEFGPISIRQFRSAIGASASRCITPEPMRTSTAFVADVEKIVREEGRSSAYPQYEPGSYTFLADYLPYANGDGMEHRNSTVMTSPGSIRAPRLQLLDTVAHEFFHNWNVERIRPRALEPFDFERANTSGELWLAEGFTQYYGPLVLAAPACSISAPCRRRLAAWCVRSCRVPRASSARQRR
jgi:hypothetical protein